MRAALLGICRFSSNGVKPPPNPTGGLRGKMSAKEMERLMNPLGFLDEKEEVEVKEQISKAEELRRVIAKYEQEKKVEKKEPYQLDKNGMPPEVGFKVKGPEPTRYGDWIGRGRLTDF